MFGISPELVAIFIPILAVIGTFAMIITVIIMGSRERELEHRERILAMEKGIEIPEKPAKVRRPAHLALRAWGFVLLLLGLVLFVALWSQVGFRSSLWGLLPAAIGVGMLLAAHYERKEKVDL